MIGKAIPRVLQEQRRQNACQMHKEKSEQDENPGLETPRAQSQGSEDLLFG
jgi:hypothetical protein